MYCIRKDRSSNPPVITNVVILKYCQRGNYQVTFSLPHITFWEPDHSRPPRSTTNRTSGHANAEEPRQMEYIWSKLWWRPHKSNHPEVVFKKVSWKHRKICWKIHMVHLFQWSYKLQVCKFNKKRHWHSYCFENLRRVRLFFSMIATKYQLYRMNRSNSPEVFLGKGILRIYTKFTEEHPCRSVILIKLFTSLLKSHFGMGVLLFISCIFSFEFHEM